MVVGVNGFGDIRVPLQANPFAVVTLFLRVLRSRLLECSKVEIINLGIFVFFIFIST